MERFRTRSYLLIALLMSITWAVIFYLYFKLTQTNNNNELNSKRNLYLYENKMELESLHRKKYPKNINDISYEIKDSYVEDKIKKKFKMKNYELSTTILNENLEALGLVKTIEEQKRRDEGFRLHAFNTLISSRLSLHRNVPDTRHERCRKLKYQNDLPNASIIICFYRESISVLLRSIHSILNRTPTYLLKEILLVDDTFDNKYHLEVKEAINGISDKIILLKTEKREGLIRARLHGAQRAKGEVLVFLDSHIEVNIVWLEPLLVQIKENYTTVATPIIDVINADTFKYTPSTLVKGGFNWGLHFKWDGIPVNYFSDKSNFVKPIKSPTMAGGLFAINKNYFKSIGEYDSGMDVWGGENLELSFRIWMCGGTLVIVPCSRIGHIFRKWRPYGDFSGEDSLLKNSLRLAHVWMGNYIEKFYELRPIARNTPYGDISERLKLKESLGCKDFDWYIKNIYPEILNRTNENEGFGRRKFERWDRRKRNYINRWQIQLSNSDFCIESEEEPSHKGSKLILSPCAELPRQIFYQTEKHELILSKLLCLEASNKWAHLGKCHDMGGNQEWKFNRNKDVLLYNMAAGLCLVAAEKRIGAYIDMALCSTPSLASWNFISVQ